MRDAAQPHVRFEVAGDGNQDMVWVIEALSWTLRRESKQAVPPKSQAPSPDPTRRPGMRRDLVFKLCDRAAKRAGGGSNPGASARGR